MANPCRVELREFMPPPVFPEWQPAMALQMIKTRDFYFLNTGHGPVSHIDWSARDLGRLWLYHLNYFDFLNIDLSSQKRRALLPDALELAFDWCNQNATGAETGWAPYPLSMRIVNWLKFLIRNFRGCASVGGGQAISRLLGSLRDQTLALEHRLETDIRANHLLKNAKALIFAGALLNAPESARWRCRGGRILARELGEQVLCDGGHIERSPMYHVQVLEDLLDLRALSASCGREMCRAPALAQRVARMAAYLRGILHPDGEIPLFNDAALGTASPAGEVLSRCGDAVTLRSGSRPRTTVFPETGYAVIRDPEAQGQMIFDCGPLGPDYQPGHGHCDVLSYELSLHNRRVVVDTGVSTYEPGSDRNYERSTAAHNTVRIDGKDQAETWASFRVGRRPGIGPIESGAVMGCPFVRGEYYGCQPRGVTHGRTVVHVPEGAWLIVDSVRGNGFHQIESFIHFHPQVVVQPGAVISGHNAAPVSRWLIRFANHAYWLVAVREGEMRLKQSWYSPEFGVRQRRSTLHWTLEGPLPAFLAYGFVSADSGPIMLRKNDENRSLQFNHLTLPLT